MRFKTFNGKFINKNYNKYRIDWNKQEKSQFQTDVKLFLKPYLYNHIVYSEMPCLHTRLRIDIYDATSRMAYEISGRQHQNYVEFFAKSRSGYLNQIKCDMLKLRFCEINNIKMIEIFPEDMPLTKQWFIEKYNLYL